MQRFGITRIRATAFHPQLPKYRTLKAALIAREANTELSQHLPTVLLGLRTALRDNNLGPALMTNGATLRIPSHFFVPTKSKIEDSDYVRRLCETMEALTSPRSSTNKRLLVYKDLSTCTHVSVRNDTVRTPLTPAYAGSYEILQRYEKYFKTQMPLRTTVVSLDKLKPAYIYNEQTTATS